MNERKLEIIKKVLNVHEWTLRENRNEFSGAVFIFDEDEKIIMEHLDKSYYLFYHDKIIYLKIGKLFKTDHKGTQQLMKVLVEDHFGLKVKNLRRPFLPPKQWWKGVKESMMRHE